MKLKILYRCSLFIPGRAKDLSAPLYIQIYDKSLARPTSQCIFLMVRIFRLILILLYI